MKFPLKGISMEIMPSLRALVLPTAERTRSGAQALDEEQLLFPNLTRPQ
jgi:hypothetical protein